MEKKKSPISVPAANPNKQPIIIIASLKLKIDDKIEADAPPKKIRSIKPQQKIENAGNSSNSLKCKPSLVIHRPIRKRRRPFHQQVQYAKTIKMTEKEKFETSKPLPSKQKASVITHPCGTHRCKEISVGIRKDSRTVKNIIIKQEVIDLTSDYDDVSLNLLFKYPKEQFLPEKTYQTCDILVTDEQTPIRIRPFTDLHTAKVLKVDVHVHLIKTVIDLTLENDEISSSSIIVMASEKECAIKILPTLHQFHQASHQQNRIMDEEALDDEIDREQTLNVSLRQICLTLIETLSGLYVKNFRIESFLEFLIFKFVQKYKVNVSMKDLALYLQSMLISLNRQHCSNQFVMYFAKELDKVVRIKCEIEKSNTCDDNLSGLEAEGLQDEFDINTN